MPYLRRYMPMPPEQPIPRERMIQLLVQTPSWFPECVELEVRQQAAAIWFQYDSRIKRWVEIRGIRGLSKSARNWVDRTVAELNQRAKVETQQREKRLAQEEAWKAHVASIRKYAAYRQVPEGLKSEANWLKLNRKVDTAQFPPVASVP